MNSFAKAVCFMAVMACIAWVISATDGWWQLLALIPALIGMSMTVDATEKPKKRKEKYRNDQPMIYMVDTRDGGRERVQCHVPVQYDGPWAHFTNEITDYGYHPFRSFYKPKEVRLEQD